MNRFLSKSRRSRHSNRRTHLLGMIVLVAVLSGILLYFTNEKQSTQVFKSYCGDFGFYGKSLVLMKDSTFRFNYYGCSQSNGSVAGEWRMNGKIITFFEYADSSLSRQYSLNNDQLISITDPEMNQFLVCGEDRSAFSAKN